jgi:hypothetical protein
MRDQPACTFPVEARGADGCYPLQLFLTATNCEFRKKVCFTTQQAEVTKMPTDEKNQPPPMLAAVTPPVVADAPVVESVGVDSAISQVKSLVPADTSPGLLIGGAALLAVLGAAFKFGPSVLKAKAERAQQAHELELEKLRMERDKTEKQDDQHKACAVERAALNARLSGLQARLDDLSEKMKDSDGLFDFDGIDIKSIDKRLKTLEKKTGPSTRGRKKAPNGTDARDRKSED